MFFNMLKKKIICHVYDKINGWKEFKTNIEYDKNGKIWLLKIQNEKIPVPENVLNLSVNGRIFVVRKGLNSYSFLDLANPISLEPKEIEVPPTELYTQITKAAMRLERMKSTLEKILPIILMVIALVGVGIFIAVVWSSVANSLNEISKNFALAMEKLEKIVSSNVTLIPAR